MLLNNSIYSLCFSLSLLFSREATASHYFMSYMGVRTCSHKTIYDIKELPKARKVQADSGVSFLSKPCLPQQTHR